MRGEGIQQALDFVHDVYLPKCRMRRISKVSIEDGRR
jgi:hypothetical protein